MGLTHASAQPVGASVVAGQAQVLSSGANTIVNQNSAKAIINWQDFSVGAGASVQFNQPNATAITLNRVTGSGVSNIDGAIRANGQVWLLNPNGVLFGNNARINVGGLLATTSDLANQDFLEGRYNFSGGGNGEIVNNGKIRAHGSVVLSGPRVTNRGLISARAGHVVLAGTDTFTVDFNGDRLLSYAVGASTQTGSVTNSGTVKAQGGQILMTARAASGVQDAVVNNTGMAEATSARSVNGEIILDAGEGAAANAGTLNASGKGAGETGGTVKLLGRDVAVTDGAAIDVSGTSGGGTVMIGGNFQGKGSEQHSQATRIGKAVINADAIASGNGGKVAVWSDGRTDFAGSITARGGASGGNGGQVETSGHDLNITGSALVSTLAPRGKSGNWLLDPHNITIVTGGNNSATSGEQFTDAPQIDNQIDPNSIVTALNSGNVTLQAATDIIFQNNLTVTGGAGNTLTLQAGRSITLGANSLSYAAGNVVMIGNDPGGAPTGFRDAGAATISTTTGIITASQLDLILNSDGVSNGTLGSSTNPILVGNATNVYLKTLNANAWLSSGGTLVIGNSNHTNGLEIGTGSATILGSNIQQSAPIIASTLTATATATGAAGTVALAGANNQIGTVTMAGNGAINLYDTVNLTIAGVTGASGGNTASFVAQGTGTIAVGNPSVGATINSTGVALLHAGGSISQGTGTSIKAQTVGLLSDNGTIGSASVPMSIMTTGLASRTLSRDQFYSVASFNSSTVLTFSNVTTTSNGFISATTTPGVNAGSGGNVVINAPTLAVNSFTQGTNTFSINAGNFQLAANQASIQGSTFNTFSAAINTTLTINNNGSFQIRNLNGGAGLAAGGNVNLTATSGSITQFSGTAGAITAPSLFGGTVTTGNIILANGQNAVPSVTFSGVGSIVFFNSVNTVLNRASYNPNGFGSQPALAAQSVDIEVTGPGRSLTIGVQGNTADDLISIKANTVNLRAFGDIIQSGSGSISAIGVSLVSETGNVGSLTASSPILRGVSTLAGRAAGDFVVNGSAPVVNGVTQNSPLAIGTVPNSGPAGGFFNGITAGGTAGLFLGPFDLTAPSPIKANTLLVSGNSIQFDTVTANTFDARSIAGNIDVTFTGDVVINNTLYGNQTTVTSTQVVNGQTQLVQTVNTNTVSGISTTGTVSLSSSGKITQAAGGGGAIIVGALSAYGVNGLTLDNSANAITGTIQFGSLNDALLVNSLASHLGLGLAGGTLTLVSGGDLELMASPSIATLANGQDVTVNNVTVLSALTLSGITGTVVSFKTGGDGVVLSTPGKFINNFGAGGLFLPGGARFLIYSADPANDTFGGLKTPNAAIFGTSYPTAVTATGNRYIFSVASSTNTDFLTASTTSTATATTSGTTGSGANAGLTIATSTAAAPALVGFVSGLQPPPRTPPPPPPPSRADVLQIQGLPPPPPPPPPPRNSPLADLSGPDAGNAEPPSSSDQATAYVASSLEGGPPLIVNGSSGGTLIPRYLTAQPALPSGTLTDPSELPGFGNLSLWQ